MLTNYRLVGLWVLFTAMVAVLSSDWRVVAAPANCQKCTCQTAPIWRVNTSPTYFGLRTGDETMTVETMFTQIRAVSITVDSSWAGSCTNTAVVQGSAYYVYSYNPGPATTCGNGPTEGYKFVACGSQNSDYTKLQPGNTTNLEKQNTCQ